MHSGACNVSIQGTQTHSEPVSKKERKRKGTKQNPTNNNKETVNLKRTAQSWEVSQVLVGAKPSMTEIKKPNKCGDGGEGAGTDSSDWVGEKLT